MPLVKRIFSNPLVLFLVGLLDVLVPSSLRWIDSGWLVALMLVAQLGLIFGVFSTVEPEDGTPFLLGFLCGLLVVIGGHMAGHSLASAYSHWLPVWGMTHFLLTSLLRRKRPG
jgi:hypothetical protein